MRTIVPILVLGLGCRGLAGEDPVGARFISPLPDRVVVEQGNLLLEAEFWGVPEDSTPVVGFDVDYTSGTVAGAYAMQRQGFLPMDCSGLGGDYRCNAAIPMDWLDGCSSITSDFPELGTPLQTTFTAHILQDPTGTSLATGPLDSTEPLPIQVVIGDADPSVHLEITLEEQP